MALNVFDSLHRLVRVIHSGIVLPRFRCMFLFRYNEPARNRVIRSTVVALYFLIHYKEPVRKRIILKSDYAGGCM